MRLLEGSAASFASAGVSTSDISHGCGKVPRHEAVMEDPVRRRNTPRVSRARPLPTTTSRDERRSTRRWRLSGRAMRGSRSKCRTCVRGRLISSGINECCGPIDDRTQTRQRAGSVTRPADRLPPAQLSTSTPFRRILASVIPLLLHSKQRVYRVLTSARCQESPGSGTTINVARPAADMAAASISGAHEPSALNRIPEFDGTKSPHQRGFSRLSAGSHPKNGWV
jgi:hypothetical protein